MLIGPGSALFVEASHRAQDGGVEVMLDRYVDDGGFTFRCKTEADVRDALLTAGAPPDRAAEIAPGLWTALVESAREA